MPRNDPKDLLPPIKCKVRHVPRPLTDAEIKAAADRAEVRSMLTATRPNDDPPISKPAEVNQNRRLPPG